MRIEDFNVSWYPGVVMRVRDAYRNFSFFDSYSGQIRIIKGDPGTGKTTELLSYMESCDPKRTAFTTFTNAGVNAAKSRLSQDAPYCKTGHALLKSPDHRLILQKHDYFRMKPNIWDSEELFALQTLGSHPEKFLQIIRPLDSIKLFKFAEIIREYKKKFSSVDFGDMLDYFIEANEPLPVDVAFIDEAQDLDPRLWLAYSIAFRNCKTIYIAGDDNQAIYTFAGADPAIMQRLSTMYPVKVLEQSYRLPKTIYSRSQKIVSKIINRIPSSFLPTSETGEVRIVAKLAHIKELHESLGESWFILARDSYSLKPALEYLNQIGCDYYLKTDSDEREWEGQYYILSTVHRVKGEEADNVVYFLDTTKRVYENTEFENEIRVSYVACTRARKRLFIVTPSTRYSMGRTM